MHNENRHMGMHRYGAAFIKRGKDVFSKLKSLVGFAKQIGSSNAKYAKKRHLDALMVCVDKGQ